MTQREINPASLIAGSTGDWEVIIGVEIHAQVKSQSKLFSRSSTTFGGEPNDQVSFVDAGMPGMLPVINEECIRQAVRTGLGLNAVINCHSVFARKNYFYPDLPQGYQISQYHKPIVGEGEVRVNMISGDSFIIAIERLHLEQDAGKLLHDYHPSLSLIDLNRSGVALMEIVSKPDLRSSKETRAYLTKIRTLLRYLDSCDGDMEKGSMRADLNVSVRKPGAKLGTRCEVKNVNSIRFAGQAVDYEAIRQIAIIEGGGEILQETRLFDPKSGKTRVMRSKEEAHDYRYFPDPDLPELVLDRDYIDRLAIDLPELPDIKHDRFCTQMGLDHPSATILTADRSAAEYFEHLAKGRNPKIAANWIINELFAYLNKSGIAIDASPVSHHQLGSIIDLVEQGKISGKIAKDLFEIIWNDGGDPETIVTQRGLLQLSDAQAIETIVDEIIDANPDQVARVRDKPKVLGWFVGQVMKASNGKANPQAVNRILRDKLSSQGVKREN